MTGLAALRDRWMGVWSGLGSRDRRALRLGGAALAVMSLGALVGSVHDGLAERRARIAESRALLAVAGQRIAARLAAGAEVSAVMTAPMIRVERVIERVGLASPTTTLQATADGGLQLALRDVPFDDLTLLLGALARWDGITVVTAEITRTQAGRVDASLVLRGP